MSPPLVTMLRRLSLPAFLVFIAITFVVGIFWGRSYWRSDQLVWGRIWCDSWNGRIVCFLDDPPPPHPIRPFSWWSNPASQDDFGLTNPERSFLGIQYDTVNGFPSSFVIPYGWVLFIASLPMDVIGLTWAFRRSRKLDMVQRPKGL